MQQAWGSWITPVITTNVSTSYKLFTYGKYVGFIWTCLAWPHSFEPSGCANLGNMYGLSLARLHYNNQYMCGALRWMNSETIEKNSDCNLILHEQDDSVRGHLVHAFASTFFQQVPKTIVALWASRCLHACTAFGKQLTSCNYVHTLDPKL